MSICHSVWLTLYNVGHRVCRNIKATTKGKTVVNGNKGEKSIGEDKDKEKTYIQKSFLNFVIYRITASCPSQRELSEMLLEHIPFATTRTMSTYRHHSKNDSAISYLTIEEADILDEDIFKPVVYWQSFRRCRGNNSPNSKCAGEICMP